jgi:hypothetical protein
MRAIALWEGKGSLIWTWNLLIEREVSGGAQWEVKDVTGQTEELGFSASVFCFILISVGPPFLFISSFYLPFEPQRLMGIG